VWCKGGDRTTICIEMCHLIGIDFYVRSSIVYVSGVYHGLSLELSSMCCNCKPRMLLYIMLRLRAHKISGCI